MRWTSPGDTPGTSAAGAPRCAPRPCRLCADDTAHSIKSSHEHATTRSRLVLMDRLIIASRAFGAQDFFQQTLELLKLDYTQVRDRVLGASVRCESRVGSRVPSE